MGKQIVEILKALVLKFFNFINLITDALAHMVNMFITGIANQLSTSKGSLIFLIVIVALADIWAKGSVGVIGFATDQIKVILELVVDVLKGIDKTVGIAIIVAAVVWTINKKK